MADSMLEARDDEGQVERDRQRELEEALQKERINNEILFAISKIYYAIFRIDLVDDVYDEIASDESVHHLTGTHGCASKELVELCNSFVRPEYQRRIMEFFDISTLAERLRDEETVAEEYHAKDGNWHTARFIAKRRDEEGNVTNVLYVTRLVSDEKRREQHWIDSAEEAERENRAKTDFLRRMSHDIRTPINGIMGMVEIEERCKDDPAKLQECRDKIRSSLEYLLDIVNNVLDIGKVESGTVALEHRPFDLASLLAKVSSVVELQAAENGLSFVGGGLGSSAGHRYLVGSPNHLNRVLMNIAGNAIKYNRAGGSVRLACEEVSSTPDTCTYRFTCEDDGVGMSADFQARAFEPFAQEGKETVSSYSGSGLGLSIVKRFVEQMGGTVAFSSEEGVGTTFTIVLPFEIDHAQSARTDASRDELPVDVSGMRALLVEDNELNREIAQVALEDEGLVVQTAANGKEALEAFEASPEGGFAFVFMDVMMPVMDGLTATRKIRALERADAREVPIIAMTANAFQDDIARSIEAGMSAHLVKPLSFEKLRQAIHQLARKR